MAKHTYEVFFAAVLKEQLQLEVFLLPAVLFYVAFLFYGKSTNSKRANTWYAYPSSRSYL
jgi:hypothetical protein